MELYLKLFAPYVCNCVLYQLLHLAATRYPHIRGGFFHVPYADGQVASKPGSIPSASLVTIARALELAVEAVITNPLDIREVGGTIC